MNYSLKIYDSKNNEGINALNLIKQFLVFLSGEQIKLIIALIIILLNAAANILAPFLLGYTIDHFIQQKNLAGITQYSLILLGVYCVVLVTSYLQTVIMGRLGQDILYRLRNALFAKIQSLPLAFFNQNKLGDLISRINNDTDKLNQFFSQSLIQFVSTIFTILGIGIFIFFIHIELAVVTLSTAFVLVIITYGISSWINKQNRLSLQSLGGLSAEIQESLNYFKVIISFDRRDYFRQNFEQVNKINFTSSVKAGIANNISMPLYDLSGNIASVLVLIFGMYLILHGQMTVGVLVTFLSYTDKFYTPLRQMASVWSNAQLALAGWNRIFEILKLESDMPIVPSEQRHETDHIMQFKNIQFGYTEDKRILKNANFTFNIGKTYAIVGPTGGGKSTIASLMTRLYDPQEGTVYFEGSDIKTYPREVLSEKIGFILQDLYLFTGTVGENIAYGNPKYATYSKSKLAAELKNLGLELLIEKFENGLDTAVTPSTESISTGQKQLISFIRAIIRQPDILIMDEATANIDTVTEGILQTIIDALPSKTTKVIIAHRLNTIKNADEIYFVNNGVVQTAGSFERSMELILKTKRNS
ncbi:ABC transporter ATP-binding protein [Candidatus Roizmanbacteria bacterium]|nr:ABC transporter ATP-binding protein [Candidatus Roizmanbacteria bacterium]